MKPITRAALLGFLVLPGPVLADSVSTMSASSSLADRFSFLDGRAAQQYAGSSRLQPERSEAPAGLAGVPRYAGRYSGPYLSLAQAAARRHGVPADLFLRLVQQESGWNAAAVSRVGALGLAQLMPGTAQMMGVDPTDPEQNLDGGARYLRMQFDAFGDWRLALAAYNAGPEAVRRYSGIPPYAETEGYVLAILGR